MKVFRRLAAVALVGLVLAVASPAYAVNHSGNQREGASVVATGNVGGGTNPVAGAGTYTYNDWNTSLGTNSLSVSPHGGFTTTTDKCAVCHAVHYAAAGTSPVGSGQTADTLLRMRADQACVYCHVTTGSTVNGTPVYDGVYPASSGGSTNTGHMTGTNCSECHASVHGSGADESVPSITGLLLKTQTPTLVTGNSTGATSTNVLGAIKAIDAQNPNFTDGKATGFTQADWTAATSVDAAHRDQAVGIFCAECHNGSYVTVEAGAATNVSAEAAGKPAANTLLTGHRIMASVETTWSGQSSGNYNGKGQVAYAPATNCASCHDAKDSFGNAAFPHSWGGTKMWLMSAPFAGAPGTALPYGTAPNSSYSTGKGQLSDGVCLKCHASSSNGTTATSGVGKTY